MHENGDHVQRSTCWNWTKMAWVCLEGMYNSVTDIVDIASGKLKYKLSLMFEIEYYWCHEV